MCTTCCLPGVITFLACLGVLFAARRCALLVVRTAGDRGDPLAETGLALFGVERGVTLAIGLRTEGIALASLIGEGVATRGFDLAGVARAGDARAGLDLAGVTREAALEVDFFSKGLADSESKFRGMGDAFVYKR